PRARPPPHSVPTRRSSDLIGEAEARAKVAQLSARLHDLDRMNVDPDIDVDVSRDIIQLRMLEAQLGKTERQAGGLRRAMARLNEDRKSTRLNSSHVKISYA